MNTDKGGNKPVLTDRYCLLTAYPVVCQAGTKRRDPESAEERRAGTDASQPVWHHAIGWV